MVPGSGSTSSASYVFRDDGLASGPEQMRIDARLLDDLAAGRSGPLFRVYGWSPPAVSIGLHQDPEREVDVAALRALGCDVVQRPTGGRAILHDDELTYAVVAPIDDPVFGGTIRESHAAISRVFRDALRKLGVPAAFAGDEGVCGRGEPVRSLSGSAAPCFATAVGTELLVGGKKIMGSAQRRKGGVFLQHGSLLLGDGHLELSEFLLTPNKNGWRERLESSTTSLSREMGRRVMRDEVVRALREVLLEMRLI